MEASHHQFRELFAQLGLPSEPRDVQSFIASHAPLPGSTRIEDAGFWTAHQAILLKELILDDADWSQLVDRLDAALRTH